jgi:hypothetical protein
LGRFWNYYKKASIEYECLQEERKQSWKFNKKKRRSSDWKQDIRIDINCKEGMTLEAVFSFGCHSIV